jgi:GlcNAc-PI de-N-acetylase
MGDVCLGSPVACQRLKIAQTALPLFASESRLMLITPHPDDEALACGIVLQRAVGADAAVRIVYAIRFV